MKLNNGLVFNFIGYKGCCIVVRIYKTFTLMLCVHTVQFFLKVRLAFTCSEKHVNAKGCKKKSAHCKIYLLTSSSLTPRKFPVLSLFPPASITYLAY